MSSFVAKMIKMSKRIAIIGASIGQIPICLKAKEMGIETYCFAWADGAVCKDIVDHFIPISIFEMDRIVEQCLKYKVDGVVSNASEKTAAVAAYVAEKISKPCTPYLNFLNIQNKEYVRKVTNQIEGLGKVRLEVGKYDSLLASFPRPFVLKPIKGAAKKGVNFVDESTVEIDLEDDLKTADFMAEQYIGGQEYSVESISYNGNHQVVQITEKIGTGAPHFVELEHHQPANLSSCLKEKIHSLIPQILSTVGFVTGASHTEIKIDIQENVYLIEVNPRGGGDEISNTLVNLSSGYDYLKGMIQVALGEFHWVESDLKCCAGIYFLCKQTENLLPFLKKLSYQPWLVKHEIFSENLTECNSNYGRNGYFIYQWNRKIQVGEQLDTDILCLNKIPNNYSLALDYIKAVNLENGNNSLTKEWVEKILRYADVLCILKNDRIVAWLVLYCNNTDTKVAYCAGLHVLSEYRGQKYAERLLDTAIDICKMRKFKDFTLYCNNPIAKNLYLKKGFSVVRKENVPFLGNKEYDFMNLNL